MHPSPCDGIATWPGHAPIADRLLFTGDDGRTGWEPWTSDGTPAGTFLVAEVETGPEGSGPSGYLVTETHGFFDTATPTFERTLWATDDGVGIAAVLDGLRFTALAAAGHTLFLEVDDGIDGAELWASDGTAAGTGPVRDICRGGCSSWPSPIAAVGERLFFTAEETDAGRELWLSDGTTAGTERLTDLCPGACWAWLQDAIPFGGRLLLIAADDNDGYGIEPYVSDGTASGTFLLRDIASASLSSDPELLGVLDNRVLFTADDLATGRELWRTDGTGAGTTPTCRS